jgi:hypothetical protein
MDALFATSTVKTVWAQLRGRKLPGLDASGVRTSEKEDVEIAHQEKR